MWVGLAHKNVPQNQNRYIKEFFLSCPLDKQLIDIFVAFRAFTNQALFAKLDGGIPANSSYEHELENLTGVFHAKLIID
jgi:hypothetical protein